MNEHQDIANALQTRLSELKRRVAEIERLRSRQLTLRIRRRLGQLKISALKALPTATSCISCAV
jgi:hypothetical protein